MGKEFFICDERLYCMNNGVSQEVTEKSHDLIDELTDKINNFYPEAMRALNECYSKSSLNVSYYNFLRVRRFLKCNCGDLDTSRHDYKNGAFNFEKISCPLRGECKYEGVICMPKFNSRLSEAEMRVMRLYYGNEGIDRVADMLYLSGHTVKNHIKSAYAKLGIHSQAEFITYANKHHLFD